MSLPRPVPSKAALNALRGLVFTTSCSVVLLAEERRQRTKIARAAVDNARKLHTIKARRNSVPLVDARAPDADFHPIDVDSMPRRRKRRKESSTDRSQSAAPRTNGHTRLSESPARNGATTLRPSDWQLDTTDLADNDGAENGFSSRLGMSESPETGLDEFRNGSTWGPATDAATMARKGSSSHWATGGEGLAKPAGNYANQDFLHCMESLTDSTKKPLSSLINEISMEPLKFASISDLKWSSPEWGSQEEMAAYYSDKSEGLDPSDVSWGLPYRMRPPPKGHEINEQQLPPKSYEEVWLSENSAKGEGRQMNTELVRLLREMQTVAGELADERADLLNRAKLYLLHSPRDKQSRSEWFQRLSGPGSAIRSFNGAKQSARKLIEDLWRAARDTDPEDKMASHYLNLAIEVLRSFPAVEQRLPMTNSHPAGSQVIKRMIQLAMQRDDQALAAIFDIVLPQCEDVPGFVAKLFDYFYSRDDGLESIQTLLLHFKRQPPHRYPLTSDQAFLMEILQRHGRLLGQPQSTQKLYSVVREATLSSMIHLSRDAEFEIHSMLLEGAMAHNIIPMISSELSSLEGIDPQRFRKDSLIHNAAIINRVLRANKSDLPHALERLHDLRTSDSEIFSAALRHMIKMCTWRLPAERFLYVIQTLVANHDLPLEDEWVQVGLDHYLSAENADFYALRSWLQYCLDQGWSAPDSITGYTNWRLGLYGDVDPEKSMAENIFHVADQCAPRDARRQEIESSIASERASEEEEDTMRHAKAKLSRDSVHLRFWRDIGPNSLFEPWEKRWLMDAARARLRDSFGELDERNFDAIWYHLMQGSASGAWHIFASNYQHLQSPTPILRLAVIARLKQDRRDPSITQHIIERLYRQGQNVEVLLQPLLMARIDRRHSDEPGPTGVISQALKEGHKIRDEVYNYAAREALKRANPNGAIAICKMAAYQNGNRNLIYCAENFSNLMRAYVSVVGLRELTYLLQMVMQQNPLYVKTRVFRDGFREAMKIMATRAVSKQIKRSGTKAAECRQFLEFMIKVRDRLDYSNSQYKLPHADVYAGARTFSEEMIADLAEDSLRQTWLAPLEPYDFIDQTAADDSPQTHKGSNLKTEEVESVDHVLSAAMSWGLAEGTSQTAENDARDPFSSTPSVPLATDGTNLESPSDAECVSHSTSYSSRIEVVPSKEQTLRSDALWSIDAQFEGQMRRARRARSATRLHLKKPRASPKQWGWDEPKPTTTIFDKITSARRTDRPAQHAESTW